MESKNTENFENEEVEKVEEIVENPVTAENDEELQTEEEKVFSFEYDVKNEEEDVAFTAFQKKFVFLAF